MQQLIQQIQKLKKTEIKNQIDIRIQEFKNTNKDSNEQLFNELCFCLLTANFNAEKCIKIQKNIGKYFWIDSKEELIKKLKIFGHRFPNTRAEYIYKAKNCKNQLKKIICSNNKKAIREWLVKNINGIGYKESSHFLRNIGFDDYAIIDFHIIDLLVDYRIIKRPKTITKNIYLKIEKILEKIAKKANLNLAELDLYLWYLETGKVLK